MHRPSVSRGSLQRRSAASLRQNEGMSNLAQELASAIDDVPGDDARSLAAEFGLEFGDSLDNGLPSTHSTPSKTSGLDRRTPHGSNDVIPEWEEEESFSNAFDDFAEDDTPNRRPFMSPKVERDPQVELEDALKLTGRVLEALRAVDSGRKIPPEDSLQQHLTTLLDAERTREEQLRELAVLERELGRVQWDEELLEGLGSLEWDALGEGDRPVSLRAVEEEAEPEEQRMVAALDDVDPDLDTSFADWPPSSPTPKTRQQSRLERFPSTTPDNVPSTIQSLHQSTSALLGVLHSLSDTLYLSSSMSVSSARQIKGIRAGVADMRERDEVEADCLDKVEKHQAAEKLRKERGGERPTESVERELREFKQVLEGYERQWSALKTIRV